MVETFIAEMGEMETRLNQRIDESIAMTNSNVQAQIAHLRREVLAGRDG